MEFSAGVFLFPLSPTPKHDLCLGERQSEGRTKNFPWGCLRAGAPIRDRKDRGDVWRLGLSRPGQKFSGGADLDPGSPAAGERCSQCSHEHLRCPRPYARRFRTCQVLFNKLPSRTAISLLGNMSLSPCFRKSTGDRSRGAAVEQLVSSSFLCSPQRRCDEAASSAGMPRPARAESWPSLQFISQKQLPNFYWTDTASLPQPAWPADLWPSAHQYLCILVKMENALVRYVNNSGKLCQR